MDSLDRRTVLKSAGVVIAACAIPALPALPCSYYERVCRAAGMPEAKIGKWNVTEVRGEGYWIPRQFERVRVGDVFRVVSPSGWECNDRGEPTLWRAEEVGGGAIRAEPVPF